MDIRLQAPFVFSLFFCCSLLSGNPSVTSVSPVFGDASGGTSVTIKGSSFLSSTEVLFGNKPSTSFTVIDDTTIQAISPVNTPGVNEITVTTPFGTSPLNPPADYYTYQGHWTVFVPDFGSNNVFPINGTTPGTAIPVGSEPNDVLVTSDGKTAFCVNSGSASITEIDVATLSVINTTHIGSSFPIYAAIAPDDSQLALADFSSNQATFVDLSTFALTNVSVGSSPTSVAYVPTVNAAFVTNTGSSNLTKIDLSTFAPTSISGPGRPSCILITPKAQSGVVSDDSTDSMFIFDIATETFGAPIPGYSLHAGNLFPQIGITPDGTTAWVANTSSNSISSVVGLNTATPSFGTTITTQSGPNGLSITPDGMTAYVSNGNTNMISIANLTHLTAVNVAVGVLPTDIGITPDQAPVAYFTDIPEPAGQSTLFDASASLSPVGTITMYEWNFGDASPVVDTSSPTISHTYSSSGIYSVTLIVTNTAGTSLTQIYNGQMMIQNGGPSATISHEVTILPSPPLNLKGKRCKNRCSCQKKFFNILTWLPSLDSNVVKYLIYRNGTLIATKLSTESQIFIDQNRSKFEDDKYSIISIDTLGLASDPETITITKPSGCCH